MARVSAIAAIGKNRVLGKGNQLLWHIPDDLKRFKQLTLGHPVIMGRKTFESIVAVLGKPLPGRTNIIVSRDPAWHYEGTLTATSIADAIEKARHSEGGEEIFIGGGGQIYAEALPLTDKLYMTLIEDSKDGDSYFPEYEAHFRHTVSKETREHGVLKYHWIELERGMYQK